ncbi:hypothetical protein CBM2598_U10105 [Cupriavidus taiwanensis]|uniref:Uncharacterized protein n=1 Tax=Cupriavidus taiwanensis TaxID=164546 RepID=A0A7Z7JFQ6_9BURK|nr:hypothetical protein CBM2597_U10246 [Cupriavidus taiwanensis]SOZ96285.1 hypothetical protein CBM2598_U10105 [Cupriavidus taiwanensis]SPC25751.1 hypothetical protein CBM2594_U10252 [Cupriavidus taiwanensis]
MGGFERPLEDSPGLPLSFAAVDILCATASKFAQSESLVLATVTSAQPNACKRPLDI